MERLGSTLMSCRTSSTRSSDTWHVYTAIFDGGRIEAEGVEAVAAAAVGSYTHVWVSSATQRPVPMSDDLREAYESIMT